MISADCDLVRDDLDAFADGELRGEELRAVAQHVDGCKRCTADVEAKRRLGQMIRESVADEYRAPLSLGLASGVVARVGAESAQSWRALFSRGVENWHWAIVGGGAVAATFVSALFCSALLLFGTSPRRADSLSTLGTNLSESAGAMYAEVSSQNRREVMFVQLATSAEPSPRLPDVLNREEQEREWVNALADTLASGGAGMDLSSMSKEARTKVEELLDNIARLRAGQGEPAIGPFGALRIHRLHLVTNTEVTAKGLD